MPYTIAQLSNLVTEGEFGRLATQLPENDEGRIQVLRDIEAQLPNEHSILKTAYRRNPELLSVALSLYPESAKLEIISKWVSFDRDLSSPSKPWLYLLAEAYPNLPYPHNRHGNALVVIQAVLLSLPEDTRVTALTGFGFGSLQCPLDFASQHAALWEACMNTLPTAKIPAAVEKRGTMELNLLHRIARRGDHNAMSLVLQTLPTDERRKLLLRPSTNEENTIDKALGHPKVLSNIFEALSIEDRLFVASRYFLKGGIPEDLFAAITAGLSRDDTLRLLTTPLDITPPIRRTHRLNSISYKPGVHTTLLYESAKPFAALQAVLSSLKCEHAAEGEQPQTNHSEIPDFLAPLNGWASTRKQLPMETDDAVTRLISILSAAKTILLDSTQTADKQTFGSICLSAIRTAQPILKPISGRSDKKCTLLDTLATEITSLASVTAGQSVFDEADGDGPVAPPEDAVVAAAPLGSGPWPVNN